LVARPPLPKNDDEKYELGKKVSDENFERIHIMKDKICSAWNYMISPNCMGG